MAIVCRTLEGHFRARATRKTYFGLHLSWLPPFSHLKTCIDAIKCASNAKRRPTHSRSRSKRCFQTAAEQYYTELKRVICLMISLSCSYRPVADIGIEESVKRREVRCDRACQPKLLLFATLTSAHDAKLSAGRIRRQRWR